MKLYCPHCGVERPIGTIAFIQHMVATYYRIPPAEMVSDRRAREVAWPRQVAMYLCRELTPKSLPTIGRYFGHRDHTTIMHGIKAVEQRIENDRDVACDIAALRTHLAPPKTVDEADLTLRNSRENATRTNGETQEDLIAA